ncbi:hypothetical protein DFP72DRAFT_613201 [Ephemerocybe angulata]|uniref:DUF6593 domain-containing protein n=1 Tax=Ephemerocybe angulata TaxID=980116 RepID=A0A8H6HIT2_9AGAR|nr:hypothetical protein DFP72DRAFT_613201 [Tulosesus angulatus]
MSSCDPAFPFSSTMTTSCEDVLSLIFEPDNPCNSIISDASTYEHLYTVRTIHGKDAITKLTSAESGTELGQWLWREVRSDILTLRGLQPCPSSVWLRKSILPFTHTASFKDFQGRKFKWKNNAPGLALELYAESNATSPVAVWKKSCRVKATDRETSDELYTPATLTVTGTGLEILDLVVISFCMLEKSRRFAENGTRTKEDALLAYPNCRPKARP